MTKPSHSTSLRGIRCALFALVLLLSACGTKEFRLTEPDVAPDTVDELVSELEKGNRVESRLIGPGASKSEKYEVLERLLDVVSNEKLLELTNHPSGVVRAWAVEGVIVLTEAGQIETDLLKLAIDHVDDHTVIEMKAGCCIMQVKVADYFIGRVADYFHYKDPSKMKTVYLSVLESGSDVDYLEFALEQAQDDEDYYPLVLKLAQGGNKDALVALSIYKKEADLELVEQLADSDMGRFMKVIANYKKPKYKPYVEEYGKTVTEIYNGNYKQSFYEAVAVFQDEFSLKMLDDLFSRLIKHDPQESHLAYMYSAVAPYKTGVYDSLFLRLWKEASEVDAEMMGYLYAKYPDESYAIIRNVLDNTDVYDWEPEVMEPALDIAFRIDKEHAIERMVANTPDAEHDIFDLFCKIGCQLKDDRLISAIKRRLEADEYDLTLEEVLSCN